VESHLETKLKLTLVVPYFSISKLCISVKVFVVYIILLTEEESHSNQCSVSFRILERPLEQNKSHKITIICNSHKIVWTYWVCTSRFSKHFRHYIRRNINFRGITLTLLDHIHILPWYNEVSYKSSSINTTNPLTAQLSTSVWSPTLRKLENKHLQQLPNMWKSFACLAA
jgi:hypothetical protein